MNTLAIVLMSFLAIVGLLIRCAVYTERKAAKVLYQVAKSIGASVTETDTRITATLKLRCKGTPKGDHDGELVLVRSTTRYLRLDLSLHRGNLVDCYLLRTWMFFDLLFTSRRRLAGRCTALVKRIISECPQHQSIESLYYAFAPPPDPEGFALD